jgi:hypothetical protein
VVGSGADNPTLEKPLVTKSEEAIAGYFSSQKLHRHHHWLDCPTWTLAFLRSFCQLKYPDIASSDFVTRVFSRVGLSVPRPTFGYSGGPMLLSAMSPLAE